MFPRFNLAIGIVFLLLILTISCSKGDPVSVDADLTGIPETTATLTAQNYVSNHYLWAYHLVYVNPRENKFEIIPLRQVADHWNVLGWLENGPCEDCLKITHMEPSGSGTVLVDIEITHPFDNANQTGFDVRGIVMLDGSHTFPESGLNMPDRSLGDGALVNVDGYTTLYNFTTEGMGPDGLEGYIEGKFASDELPDALLNGYKRFISGGLANARNAFTANDTVTVTYELDLPDSPYIFGYAVDACWAPPLNKPVENPLTDFGTDANSPEAWKLEVEDQGPGLDLQGGTTKLIIDVYDWQGKDDVHPVTVECPELFDGTVEGLWIIDGIGFTRYEAEVANTNLAGLGDYPCLISKEAQENDPTGKPWLNLTACQIFYVTVSWPDGYPMDLTPQRLIYSPKDIVADGDCAYIAAGYCGLLIFDISDPTKPAWLNSVDTPGFAEGVAKFGNLVYLADGSGGLQIIDVDPPESAEILNTVNTGCKKVYVSESGEYAYVSRNGGVSIIDVNPPESAFLINSVDNGFSGESGFAVSEGYAYVTIHEYISSHFYFNIFDVDPPESAYCVNSPDTGTCFRIAARGDYVYLDYRHADILGIKNVSDPESPYSVGHLGIEGQVGAFSESGEYAYVADWSTGLHIANINPPESAYVEKSVQLPINEDIETDLDVSNGYAYYIGETLGLFVVDIDPPETAARVGSFESVGETYKIAVGDNCLLAREACIDDHSGGGYLVLSIIDYSSPETARVVCSFKQPDGLRDFMTQGDYAYVSTDTGLMIIDSQPSEVENIINTIDTPVPCNQAVISGGYAYVTGEGNGLMIIDIDPPESAYFVNTVDMPNPASSVAVSGDFAYVTDGELQIIDIDPPESAHILNTVSGQGICGKVLVEDGYAYISKSSTNEFQIVDIDPPESAHIVKVVSVPNGPYDIAVSGEYLFVAGGMSGLSMYDVNPPQQAHMVTTFDFPDKSFSIGISGNYLASACAYLGLRILKLW